MILIPKRIKTTKIQRSCQPCFLEYPLSSGLSTKLYDPCFPCFMWSLPIQSQASAVHYDPSLHNPRAVDSDKLEYGFRVSCAGFPSFYCVGIQGRSHSNFPASTVMLRRFCIYLLYNANMFKSTQGSYACRPLLSCDSLCKSETDQPVSIMPCRVKCSGRWSDRGAPTDSQNP